jgi:hypothetical protein
MSDIVDDTQEREERFMPYQIAASRKPVGPAPNGHCHFCDAPVAEGLRFCDAACRDGYERETSRKRIGGL